MNTGKPSANSIDKFYILVPADRTGSLVLALISQEGSKEESLGVIVAYPTEEN